MWRFKLNNQKKVRRSESRQYAYLYVEDYSWYLPQVKKEEDEQQKRGMVEIDLNNGKATEST